MIMIFTKDIEKMVLKYGKKIKKNQEAEVCRMVTVFLYERNVIGLQPQHELPLLDLLEHHLVDISL